MQMRKRKSGFPNVNKRSYNQQATLLYIPQSVSFKKTETNNS